MCTTMDTMDTMYNYGHKQHIDTNNTKPCCRLGGYGAGFSTLNHEDREVASDHPTGVSIYYIHAQLSD